MVKGKRTRFKGELGALIVEDEIALCTSLKIFLEDTSLFRSVITACDGSEAMAKITNQEFDVIILDNQMPKVTGIDVIRWLRKEKIKTKIDNSETPLIFLSGNFESEDVKEAVGWGIKYILAKPFKEKQFVDVVVKAIGPLHH